MALRAASQTCSIPPSHSVFNLFLLASFLHFNVCDSPPSVRSGKMSRTKHCGGLRMFGVFVAWPAGCIKREVEGEDEGGWGGVSRLLSGRSSIQKQSSRTPGWPFTSSAPRPPFVTLSPPYAAPTTSQNLLDSRKSR